MIDRYHASDVTNPESPYFGMRNLLELILPQTVDHYLENVTRPACDCRQCRRDILACALASLKPIYYGSVTPERLEDLRIQLRTVSFEEIDQQIRRAIAFVGEVPHHNRDARPRVPIETARPEEVQERVVEQLAQRPLLEQLYGVPVPLCLACNEVGRRSESHYCDKCGQKLVMGLPSTSVRVR